MVKLYYTLSRMKSGYGHRVWAPKTYGMPAIAGPLHSAMKALSMWKGADKSTDSYMGYELGDEEMLYLMSMKDVECIAIDNTNGHMVYAPMPIGQQPDGFRPLIENWLRD